MDVTTASTKRRREPENHAARPYDGTLRRKRAAETRERIIVAGSELLHGASVRDWRELTVRAVAERAGVNERTVYRYFGNERGLRDAMLKRNEEKAGIDLRGMQLADIGSVAAQILAHVSEYPRDPRPPLVPTLIDAKQRQQAALHCAVAASAESWSDEDQLVAAAMLDALWSVATYERLVGDWQIDHQRAVRGISWVLELVAQAVEDGHGPT